MSKLKMIFSGYRIPFFLVICLLLVQSFLISVPKERISVQTEEKQHPTLVDPSKTNCSTCHEDLLKKAFIHTIVKEESCDVCHEMNQKEDKTFVTLMAKGNDLCLACHSDIEEAMSEEYVHPVVEEGCDLCHDPHSSDNANQLISTWKDLCSTCHEVEDEDFKEKHGMQPVTYVGCGLCHNPHGSSQEKLLTGMSTHAPFEGGECSACHKRARGTKITLRADRADLCYACHSDKEQEFQKNSVHSPVARGECEGCHDPHLTNNEYLLKAHGKSLCLKCHYDREDLLKADYVHPPAEESCEDCHSPHASGYLFQLTDSMTNICLACHDGEDEAFISDHYNQDPQKIDCVECHNPHGSDNERLLNTYTHPPFSERECETCHEVTEENNKIELVTDDINELCTICHDDKSFEDAGEDIIIHAALEGEGCTACHSGHAASRKNLLKDHTSRLCTACHDDILDSSRSEKYIHAVIQTNGCESCHESHFSTNEKLLLEKMNTLCLECHLYQPGQAESDKDVTLFGKFKVKEARLARFTKIALSDDLSRGHPQMNHPVFGNFSPGDTNINRKRMNLIFSGKLTCLSCHDSHTGSLPQLFINDITTPFEVCLKCHKK